MINTEKYAAEVVREARFGVHFSVLIMKPRVVPPVGMQPVTIAGVDTGAQCGTDRVCRTLLACEVDDPRVGKRDFGEQHVSGWAFVKIDGRGLRLTRADEIAQQRDRKAAGKHVHDGGSRHDAPPQARVVRASERTTTG